jgi:hypothetical protein
MSSRSKGVWGINPTTASQYQRKPRHIRKADVQGGCLVALVMIITAAMVAAKTL